MKTPQMYDEPRLATAAHTKTQSPRDPLPRDRKRPMALFAAVALIAALIAGGSVYVWQRIDARDRTGALENAISERNSAQDQVATSMGRLDGLQARLADARADAKALEGQLANARDELRAMLGPTLPDGKHFGALIAVGASQKPPRLVIDIEQWFTEQAAIDAAIQDSVIEPGEIIPNAFYIRNENPRWRTIEVDPTTTVSLTVYPFGQVDDPQIVSLERFADLEIGWSEYWITVEDGRVVAIEQQYIP